VVEKRDAERGMVIGPDPAHDPVHGAATLRPFGGAARAAWMAGRVRALREAEDDAQTVLAFQLTGLATHAIDPAEVVWVIDLAPAEGERAWRVLKALSGRAPRGAPIRYMACCVDSAHHARLAAHPLLKPLVSNGSLLLEHAFLDHSFRDDASPDSPFAHRQSARMPAHIVRNPIVVLAHEGISSLSQGLFASRSGELLEAWRDGRGGLDWRATTRRDGVMRLLSTYRQSIDDAAFTLPHGAMRALSALLQTSGGRLLLRASDLGAKDIAQLRRGALDPERSDAPADGLGSALSVNFEALARWHRTQGGSVHQSQRDDDGRVLHIALHDIAGGRLQECLPEVLGLPHPDDHVQLLLAMEALSAVSPAQCLSLLHAQAGDPRALRALSRHIPHRERGRPVAAQEQWREMIAYCRRLHFPRCDGSDEDDAMFELFETMSAGFTSLPPAGPEQPLLI
jgi:hypothetical protein